MPPVDGMGLLTFLALVSRTSPLSTTTTVQMSQAHRSQVHRVLAQAKRVGDHAPDFSLVNHLGETVHLESLRRRGPVVVSFYRGSWCDYCVQELRSLKDALPGLRKAGAAVVAISPEVPRQSRATRHSLGLGFEVLSDISNVVARRFALVYQLEPKLQETYQKFGIDLVDHNGDDSYELPVPATYLIDRFGVIRHAFLDADHRRRAAPEDLLAAASELGIGNGQRQDYA